MNVLADEFTIGGLSFTSLSDKEVKIKKSKNQDIEFLDIPQYVSYNGKKYKVTSIGIGVFGEHRRIKEAKIPNGIKVIEQMAFMNCDSLKSIFIPKSVTNIEKMAFSNQNIENIIIDTNNPIYDSRNNCNAIIETKSNTLLLGCKNTIIPDGVVKISDAFHCNISTINIPKSVTSINKDAFKMCWFIEKITVDKDNPIFDSRNNCNAIIETRANILIHGCQNTMIPNSVKNIGDYAFESCLFLHKLYIPNGVKEVGDYAFINCNNIKVISLPKTLTRIGKNAFSGISILDSIYVDAGNPIYDSRGNCNALIETKTNKLLIGTENTIIPNSVVSVADMAFGTVMPKTPKAREEIIIPESVIVIGNRAFFFCENLVKVTCKRKTPPIVGLNIFHPYSLRHGTLHVPKGSIEAYRKDPFWGKFSTIIEE